MNEPTMESLDTLFKRIEIMAKELDEQVKSNRYFNYKCARSMSEMTEKDLREIYSVTYGKDVAEDLEKIYQAERRLKNGK